MKNIENKNLIIKLATLFYLSSFLGYFYELLLCYLYTGKVFSHGFLRGPWLPIYGIGSLLLTLLNKFKDNFVKVFLIAFILTGTFEGISAFLLLKIFKMRLWDYTGYFLNIDGFVCFLSAFCFGLGGLFIVYILYPLINKLFKKINPKTLESFLSILSLIFISDLIATILK